MATDGEPLTTLEMPAASRAEAPFDAAGIERRLDTLERSFAALTAAEDKVLALVARLDRTEDDINRQFDDLRARLAALETRNTAPEPVTKIEPVPDAPAAVQALDKAPTDETSTPDDKIELKNHAPARADYLTGARRAARASVRETAPSIDTSRHSDNRGRLVAAAVLAPVVILGTALMALDRNTVTASPIASGEPPSIQPLAFALEELPPVPSERPADSEMPQAGSLRSLAELEKAAGDGDAAAMRDAGLKYLLGDDVDASDAEAARWLIRAAYRGEPEGQFWLATLYARGNGIPKDLAQAVHWYEAAAKHGLPRAMHNLAIAKSEGWTEDKNLTEAMRWFEEAADLGYADSSFNLAVLYEQGTAVPQDMAEAFKWYSVAAAAGDSEAARRVEALVPRLTPDDIAAAQAAIAAIKPGG